jgi:hypothetical protein
MRDSVEASIAWQQMKQRTRHSHCAQQRPELLRVKDHKLFEPDRHQPAPYRSDRNHYFTMIVKKISLSFEESHTWNLPTNVASGEIVVCRGQQVNKGHEASGPGGPASGRHVDQFPVYPLLFTK